MDDRRRLYFDDIAGRWDTFGDRHRMFAALREEVRRFGIGAHECVLDLGSGTGTLTEVLLEEISDGGLIVAADFSGEMLEVARRKIADDRVGWIVADAAGLPLAQKSLDRVLCYSAWPHFPQPERVVREMYRVLRPEGKIHIFHTGSRETVNSIHAGAGGPIGHDVLPPASELQCLLEREGFRVTETVDDAVHYSVTAVRTRGDRR